MVTIEQQPASTNLIVSTLADRMQSAGPGEFVTIDGLSFDAPEYEEENIYAPGELLPGDGLRLSNTREAMPELIVALRKWRGMTQAQLAEAIGYPVAVIGHIEQGRRKVGVKILSDLFDALGGDLYIEYRER